MKDVKYLFIVNPKAGQGRSTNLIPLIESGATDRGVPYEVVLTTEKGQAQPIAAEAVDNGFTHIISVGGDGTTHEIVNGILGSDITVGILPSGSGNDFPKSSGISSDSRIALNTVFEGREILADVGRLGGEYFINGLGIGLDGSVSHRFRKLKRMRLQAGYLLAAVQEALTFKAFEAVINIDDWHYEGTILLTGASNGFSQGGFKLAPQAKVDDGLMDFHVITDMNSISRLIKIPKVLKGVHSTLSEVEIINGHKMDITINETVPAHMDGEPFYMESGTHSIEIYPRSLRILSDMGE